MKAHASKVAPIMDHQRKSNSSSRDHKYHSGGFSAISSIDDVSAMDDGSTIAFDDASRRTSITIQGDDGSKKNFRISLSYVDSDEEDDDDDEERGEEDDDDMMHIHDDDDDDDDEEDEDHELDGYERYLRQIGAAVQSAPASEAFAVPGNEGHRSHKITPQSKTPHRGSRGRHPYHSSETTDYDDDDYDDDDDVSEYDIGGSSIAMTNSVAEEGPIVYVGGGGGHDLDDESVTFLSNMNMNRGKRKMAVFGVVSLAILAATAAIVVLPRNRSSHNNNDPSAAQGLHGAVNTSTEGHEHHDSIMAFLGEYTIASDLQNATSPQRHAVKWLIDDPTLDVLFRSNGNGNGNGSANPPNAGQTLDEKLKLTVLERYALATFYYATGGPIGELHVNTDAGWKEASDWLDSEKHVCTWSGVSCNEFDLVKSIRLPGNHLGGFLPEELGLLNELAKLDLSHNSISGPMPNGISKLIGLTDLRLGKNRISGNLEPDFFDNVQGLEVLILDDNAMTGPIPPSIAKSRSLFLLRLGQNQFSGGIPTEFGFLQFLFELDLGGNDFKGVIPTELGNLSELQQLRLGRNGFTGQIPQTLSRLGELVDLELEENLLTGTVPEFLSSISSLKKLYLDGNAFGGAVPASLGSLSSLSELSLEKNKLTGTMPQSVCELGLRLLSTDCQVECNCCTVVCSNPAPN